MKLLIAIALALLLAAGACKNTNDNKPAYDLVPSLIVEAAV